MKLKDHLIIIISVAFVFTILNMGKEKVYTIIHNNYITVQRDSIIQDYKDEKDSIKNYVESISHDSSYNELINIIDYKLKRDGSIVRHE